MSIISKVLLTLVSLLFFYIMYLETFQTTSKKTSQVFNISQNDLSQPALNTLFKNQGIYNGLIGLVLLYSTFISKNGIELSYVMLLYILGVATYGAMTSNKSILIKQGGLPILALISLILFH